jgi:methylated-DNA-protein-cysteine methyltransferase-like protein
MMFNPPNAQQFFKTVWDIVRQIPEGNVSTYGQIASMIPSDNYTDPEQMKRLAPRWVGTAMRKTPKGLGIPWHRVINSQGKISFPVGSAQADEQMTLLEMEGVRFDARGQVDFQVVGWVGPSDDYLESNDLLPPRALR